ncbi:fructosamine kinase family protein [Muriicola marianensis]|uniref:Fructosamine kinase n=1 Tax=Muriicola marianensis TaxID=1324801 RepID=A0ABQ1QWV1_9FLAO|nr:fructosamine kinase family protein [Muriicola marianensis]GGD50279.1 fructosamine kinase [Muriicola marianensis]
METSLREHIEAVMGRKILSANPVSGGDISLAFKIDLEGEPLFCKYHKGAQGFTMLQAEKTGLEAISATGCIKTPRVLHLGKLKISACLLMEYVERGHPSEKNMAHFGEQLARLHGTKQPLFGWDTDNFIGSLPQSNASKQTWPEFYTTERLGPQLRMAFDKGLLSRDEVPGENLMEARLRGLCSETRPSLIHGDLWGGNYLISTEDEAYLIDPSVSYSHPGMDLAMSRLFGGFSPAFYSGYESAASDLVPEQDEIELYQLYYLLVHLNLFGVSYAASVKRILRRFF